MNGTSKCETACCSLHGGTRPLTHTFAQHHLCLSTMADSILPLQGDEHAAHQDAEADAEAGFTSLVLQTFRGDVEEAMASMLLPAARDISQSIEMLQAQAQEAATDSRNELNAAQAEVERLSRLIFSFQQAVAALLPFQ